MGFQAILYLMPVFELVVPAYNESENLPDLVTRTVAACQKAGLNSETFQLVLVNNGSTDASAEILQQLKDGPQGAYFRVVCVFKNQGYGHGIKAGLDATTADFVGWSHADMQCDPLDAFKALAVLRKSSKKALVKGYRSGRNWKDQLVTRVFEGSAKALLGVHLDEINAQPKVFHRSLLPFLKNPPTGISFDLYVLYHALKQGYLVKTIDVLLPPRIHGTSKWASHFLMRYKTFARVLRDISKISFQEGRL